MIYGMDFDEYCGEWDEDEDAVGQYWDRLYDEMRDRALDLPSPEISQTFNLGALENAMSRGCQDTGEG